MDGDYTYIPPASGTERGYRVFVRREERGGGTQYNAGRDGARIVAAYDVTPWPENVNATLIALVERCERLEERVEMLENIRREETHVCNN